MCIKQMTNKPPTANSKGLRRNYGAAGDGEMENVFAKDAKKALDDGGEARQRHPAQVRGRQQKQGGSVGPRFLFAIGRGMEKRVLFRSAWLPYVLLAPQIAITIVFFFWPATQAIWFSFQLQDAFGLKTEFVGLRNFEELFRDSHYLESFKVTAVFSVLVATFGIGISLMLATMADPCGARGHRVQDAADLALRRGARGGGCAVGVPVRAFDRHPHLRAETLRSRLELGHPG
jgi:hypothetical protein